jgi:L-aspartate oxidase
MKSQNQTLDTEFIILGSGIAGLRAAIELSNNEKQVHLFTKSNLEDSNTYYAQGGIASVDPLRVEQGEDTYGSHIQDTLKAGDGLCDPYIVKNFAENAHKDVTQFLMDQGVEFSKNNPSKGQYPYVLHQEGGHQKPRIYCVGDSTGKSIEETLADKVRNNPNIIIHENHTAINLITKNEVSKTTLPNDKCLGAYILDRSTGDILTVKSKKTFLATGGAGRVFQYTSNPSNATGDGIAMAYKAGARVANMEFFQFHPSVLYEPNTEDSSEKRFLITEALRGKTMGGILTLKKDSLDDFVLNHHPDGSHATRDVVARAIDTEIKLNGLKHVWLNVTPQVTGKSEEHTKDSFPMIYKTCLEKGIDMTKEPIPVIPAAHYTCGGVVVNEFGLTDLDNLYAIGEVAYTGLMGANRLASNSLSEAGLYGGLAVEHALATSNLDHSYNLKVPSWNSWNRDVEIDNATMNQFWDTTRSTMTNLCGIDRNEQRLKLATKTINALVDASDEIYYNLYPAHEIIELRNLTLVSKLIADSALQRKESRGGHYRSDFPNKNEEYAQPTIMRKN